MKLSTSVLAIIAAFTLTGFSSKYSNQELSEKLIQTWEGHSQRDEEFQQIFFAFANKMAAHSPEVREKLESYKKSLEITDEKMLVNLIFLLRRMTDKDSFYAAMTKWNTLPESTQGKIMGHFGSTYKAITANSLVENQKLVDLLGKRKTARNEVIAGLPKSFQDAIGYLNAWEIDGYLESIYLVMLNTVSVMKFLGVGEEPKEDL